MPPAIPATAAVSSAGPPLPGRGVIAAALLKSRIIPGK